MNHKKFKFLVPILGACLLTALGIWWAAAHRNPDPASRSAARNAAKGSAPEGTLPRRPASAATVALRQRMDSATVADYPELIRLAFQLQDPAARDELIAQLMRRWLDVDLRSFVVFLDEIEVEGGQIWSRLAPGLMAALKMQHPPEADSFLLRSMIERVILKVAGTDPQNALVWAREWLAGDNLDSALAGIATELVTVDPQAAMDLVSEIKALSNRMAAASGVGMIMGERNPDLGLAWAASFTLESERAFAMAGVLTGMADRDCDRAAAEYSQLVEAMKAKYRELVLADRAASGTSTEEEYEGLTPEEIEKAELARPNPNLIYLEKAAFIIGAALTREDPQRALRWAKSLDIYQGRVTAIEAVFEEWTSIAPQTAYESYLQETGRRPDLAQRVFGTWAATDPAAASAAALALTPGTERENAVEGVARGWIDSGAPVDKIARWSEDLQFTSEKDRVHAVVASEAAFDNPVFAWKQVEQIQNHTKRSELFQEIFPSLAENNPQIARRALASVRLSAVETEYLENMLGK